VTVRAVCVALLWHPFPPAMPEWHALAMREPFLAVGLLGMCVSLGRAMSFWRLAPAASIALIGGLAGATAGLVGWVFVPENLQQLDLIDGGIQASYGDGLPAAAGVHPRDRPRRAGVVASRSRTDGLPRVFTPGFRRCPGRGYRVGVGRSHPLDGACAQLGTQSCSETLMVAGSIILDAVVVGILLLVSAPPHRCVDVRLGALRSLRQRGAAHPARR